MKNEFVKMSVDTMVGMFPLIVNQNNQYISEEFDIIRKNNKIILDVSSNGISAHTASFVNLELNGTTINSSIFEKMNSSINAIELKIQSLNASTNSAIYTNTPSLFSASRSSMNVEEYDMSSFFTTSGKAKLLWFQVNDLCNLSLYRILDDIKIPLQIGTISFNGKIRMIIYHDHIDNDKVQRVYSTVVNNSEKNAVVQYGSASAINL